MLLTALLPKRTGTLGPLGSPPTRAHSNTGRLFGRNPCSAGPSTKSIVSKKHLFKDLNSPSNKVLEATGLRNVSIATGAQRQTLSLTNLNSGNARSESVSRPDPKRRRELKGTPHQERCIHSSFESLVICFINGALTALQALIISELLIVASDPSQRDLTSTTAMNHVSYIRVRLDQSDPHSKCPRVSKPETFVPIGSHDFHNQKTGSTYNEPRRTRCQLPSDDSALRIGVQASAVLPRLDQTENC